MARSYYKAEQGENNVWSMKRVIKIIRALSALKEISTSSFNQGILETPNEVLFSCTPTEGYPNVSITHQKKQEGSLKHFGDLEHLNRLVLLAHRRN